MKRWQRELPICPKNNCSNHSTIIELFNVATIYEGERIPAIRDINLRVKEGEFLSIIGPNGAGKTTLLETINGLLEHTKGKIHIFGREIKKFGSSVRKEIGYIPQEFVVDDLTPFLVKDVILMGRFGKMGLLKSVSDEDRQKVKDAMDTIEINGLSTRPVGKLSGGQLQKVMIARALAKDPKILLLDEPFSNLDFKATREISERLSHLHDERDLTTVMVIHDITSIPERCHRVILMNAGRVIKDDLPHKTLDPMLLKLAYEVEG